MRQIDKRLDLDSGVGERDKPYPSPRADFYDRDHEPLIVRLLFPFLDVDYSPEERRPRATQSVQRSIPRHAPSNIPRTS